MIFFVYIFSDWKIREQQGTNNTDLCRSIRKKLRSNSLHEVWPWPPCGKRLLLSPAIQRTNSRTCWNYTGKAMVTLLKCSYFFIFVHKLINFLYRIKVETFQNVAYFDEDQYQARVATFRKIEISPSQVGDNPWQKWTFVIFIYAESNLKVIF